MLATKYKGLQSTTIYLKFSGIKIGQLGTCEWRTWFISYTVSHHYSESYLFTCGCFYVSDKRSTSELHAPYGEAAINTLMRLRRLWCRPTYLSITA